MTSVAIFLVACALIVMPSSSHLRIVDALRPPVMRERAPPIANDPALGWDLAASCVLSGIPAIDALVEASALFDYEQREQILSSVAKIRFGAHAIGVWRELIDSEHFEFVATGLARSELSGTCVSEVFTAQAQRLRATQSHEAVATAERAGVHLAAPLGLCFLPAFVFLGIFPTVSGLFDRTLPALFF